MRALRFTFMSIACMLASANALAAPDDVYLSARSIDIQHPLQVETSYDLLNKTVDIFNLRSRQGPVADGAGDYQGGYLKLNYALSPQWLAEAAYWNRNIDYSQDTNQINSWLAAINYNPALSLAYGDQLTLRFSVWGNFADKLTKKSATDVNGTTLSNLEVNKLQDLQAQFDVLFSRRLDEQNKLNGFVSAGYSKVDVDHLSAVVKKQGCLFDVDVNSSGQLSGQLTTPCKVNGTTLSQASFTAPASSYGLDMDKDLSYNAGFMSVGASWNWRYEKFSSQLGYQFQYLIRQNVDDRVEQQGHSPIRYNQTLGLELAYQVHPSISLFVRSQAFQNNFVGTIPFLYNSVTASRLDRNYGYASLGIRFANF